VKCKNHFYPFAFDGRQWADVPRPAKNGKGLNNTYVLYLLNGVFPVIQTVQHRMKWKLFGRKRSWLHGKDLSLHSPGETEEKPETIKTARHRAEI
jgi:hypothetical protein